MHHTRKAASHPGGPEVLRGDEVGRRPWGIVWDSCKVLQGQLECIARAKWRQVCLWALRETYEDQRW